MKKIAIIIVALALTGCASLVDGLLGRYHNYDSSEYMLTVDLVHQARALESKCPTIQADVAELRRQTLYFITYAEGRRYNQRTVELGQSLAKILKDTEVRPTMSAFFCKERSKNIVRATETLRDVAGRKPE
jgi:hypothetical protein